MLPYGQGARPARTDSVSYVIVIYALLTDYRLRCKCKYRFKMYNYIFATSGGVHALTQCVHEATQEGVAPLRIAATHKCRAGTDQDL